MSLGLWEDLGLNSYDVFGSLLVNYLPSLLSGDQRLNLGGRLTVGAGVWWFNRDDQGGPESIVCRRQG